ncbi:hypothetical protein A2G06_03745 [Geobacter anodireducens]|nr:hypothetical protein A2G06_03745 [Geobacter anodireducens]
MARMAVLPALILCLWGCSMPRGWEAVLILTDLTAGRGPSGLTEQTPPPRRLMVPYAVEGRNYRGDLYLPGERIRAGLVLLPGAAGEGTDDPRLQAFAATLARARFAVLVPDLAGFRSLRAGSRDIGETADAIVWLSSRPELSPGGKCGVAALSYAAGPALLAALEPRAGQRVRFLVTVGGYYDLRNVLTFFTTGWYRDGERWRRGTPNDYGKWVFVLANAGRIENARDRAALEKLARRKMDDPAARTDDLARGLGPEGKSLYDFFANTDPRQVPALMARLPEPIRRDMADLDPSRHDLRGLATRLIIIHGRDDDIIPAAESEALARAVPRDRRRLFVLDDLMHVELKPKLSDAFRLWQAVSAILQERDRT